MLVNTVHVEEGYHPPHCAASRAELLYDTPMEGHKELSSDSIVIGERLVRPWSSYGVKKSLKVKKDYLINARKWMKVSMNASFLSANADIPGISSVLKVPTKTVVSLWCHAFTEQVRKARRHMAILQLAMVVKPFTPLAT